MKKFIKLSSRNSDRYYSKSRVTMVSPQFQYFFDTMEILIQILLR